jgi:hypothetical protein
MDPTMLQPCHLLLLPLAFGIAMAVMAVAVLAVPIGVMAVLVVPIIRLL